MSTEQAIDIPQGYKMTELGLLPEEWQVVRLGEVAEAKGGNSFPLKYQGDTKGKYPFFKVADMNNLGNEIYMVKYNHSIGEEVLFKLKAKAFPKDTIIFPKVGGAVHTNKKRILTKDSLVDNNIMCVIPLTKFLYPFYAFCFFQNFDLKSICNPGPLPSINSSSVRDLLLPLPPFPEQRAIAHILQTVQVAKEKIEGVIQAAKELKKSLLKYLFTYGPVPVEDAEKVPLKKTEIGLVPEEWGVIKLTDVIQGSFSGGTPSSKVAKYWNGNIPWTTTSPINVNDVFLNDCLRYISEEGLNNSSSKIAPKGSVLIGTRVGVGKAVVTNIDIAINQDLTALELKSDLLPVFFAYLAKTKVIQSFFLNLKRGATIKGIPRNDLLHMSIPLPPLQIQKRIADVLTVIDKRIEASEARKQALETLFHSLLYNLMRGAIRIPAHMEIRSDPSFISGRV